MPQTFNSQLGAKGQTLKLRTIFYAKCINYTFLCQNINNILGQCHLVVACWNSGRLRGDAPCTSPPKTFTQECHPWEFLGELNRTSTIGPVCKVHAGLSSSCTNVS